MNPMNYDYLPEVYDQDPYSDKKFRFDVSQELSLDDFLNQLKVADDDESRRQTVMSNFYKICDCKLKNSERYKKASSIPFDYVPLDKHKDQYKKRGEVVYIIVFDGNVVKIGFTTDGMKNRHTSYNAGSRTTRKKGTPSTTNFHITESIYTALSDGKKVEWYAYDVPPAEVTTDCFGTGIMKTMKVSYGSELESYLIDEYVRLKGHRPILSKNS
jgi:hypothetical protein|tara:strand:- start:69 stop:710 length:642 start_codon:yes stop_codon:yes gene_type:complete